MVKVHYVLGTFYIVTYATLVFYALRSLVNFVR